MRTVFRRDKQAIVAWCEIGYVLSCVLVAEWIIPPRLMKNPLVYSIPLGLVLIGGLISHVARRERPSELGFRMDNFLGAIRLLLAPMLIVCCALVVVGWSAGGLNFSGALDLRQVLQRGSALFLWGLQQQYALHAIINRRAQIIWGRGWISVLAVAVVFCGLHLPNPALVVATFVGGIIWARAYQRAANLFALAVSHCIMTMVLVAALPPAWLHGLRVGAGYYALNRK